MLGLISLYMMLLLLAAKNVNFAIKLLDFMDDLEI